MIHKYSFVALSIMSALALSGCGSDSDSDSSTDTESSSFTVTAIDGYLSGAEIYVDCDDDGSADSATPIGSTDSNGDLSVSDEYETCALIVRTVVGVTEDSDTGIVTEAYEMIADAGSTEVTPFTTLAHLYDVEIEDLVAILDPTGSIGLTTEDISGDYIASESDNAESVQLIARSISTVFEESLDDYSETPQDDIESTVSTIIDAVEIVLQDDTQTISDLIIEVSDDGEVIVSDFVEETEEVIEELSTYVYTMDDVLDGITWYVASLAYWQESEDNPIYKSTFQLDGSHELTRYDSSSDSVTTTSSSYEVQGSKVVYYASYYQDLKYLSDTVTVTIDDDGLVLWLTNNFALELDAGTLTPLSLSADTFSGATWQQLSSQESTELDGSAISFNADGTYTANSYADDSNTTASWEIVERSEDSEGGITGSYSVLQLDTTTLILVEETADVLVFINEDARNEVVLMIKDTSTAETIYDAWVNAEENYNVWYAQQDIDEESVYDVCEDVLETDELSGNDADSYDSFASSMNDSSDCTYSSFTAEDVVGLELYKDQGSYSYSAYIFQADGVGYTSDDGVDEDAFVWEVTEDGIIMVTFEDGDIDYIANLDNSDDNYTVAILEVWQDEEDGSFTSYSEVNVRYLSTTEPDIISPDSASAAIEIIESDATVYTLDYDDSRVILESFDVDTTSHIAIRSSIERVMNDGSLVEFSDDYEDYIPSSDGSGWLLVDSYTIDTSDSTQITAYPTANPTYVNNLSPYIDDVSGSTIAHSVEGLDDDSERVPFSDDDAKFSDDAFIIEFGFENGSDQYWLWGDDTAYIMSFSTDIAESVTLDDLVSADLGISVDDEPVTISSGDDFACVWQGNYCIQFVNNLTKDANYFLTEDYTTFTLAYQASYDIVQSDGVDILEYTVTGNMKDEFGDNWHGDDDDGENSDSTIIYSVLNGEIHVGVKAITGETDDDELYLYNEVALADVLDYIEPPVTFDEVEVSSSDEFLSAIDSYVTSTEPLEVTFSALAENYENSFQLSFHNESNDSEFYFTFSDDNTVTYGTDWEDMTSAEWAIETIDFYNVLTVTSVGTEIPETIAQFVLLEDENNDVGVDTTSSDSYEISIAYYDAYFDDIAYQTEMDVNSYTSSSSSTDCSYPDVFGTYEDFVSTLLTCSNVQAADNVFSENITYNWGALSDSEDLTSFFSDTTLELSSYDSDSGTYLGTLWNQEMEWSINQDEDNGFSSLQIDFLDSDSYVTLALSDFYYAEIDGETELFFNLLAFQYNEDEGEEDGYTIWSAIIDEGTNTNELMVP